MADIRLATPDDVPALVEVARAAYVHYIPRIGRLPAPMTADYGAAVRAGHTWVARTWVDQHERIVGLLVLVPEADHLLLENVAVRPGAQGGGIGRLLLAHAEHEAVRLGYDEIRLYTNASMTENLAYYPRRGYVETHRASSDGFHRVFFTKHL